VEEAATKVSIEGKGWGGGIRIAGREGGRCGWREREAR